MSTNGNPLALSDKAQTTPVTIRFLNSDLELIEKKAGKSGQNRSDWMRDVVLSVPEYDPHSQSIREAFLDRTLDHYLTESNRQYAEFLRRSEQLFSPLAEQLSNHREWMRGTLLLFHEEFSKTVSECRKQAEEAIQTAGQSAARANEIEQNFYRKWVWICLGMFAIATVLGFALGRWM